MFNLNLTTTHEDDITLKYLAIFSKPQVPVGWAKRSVPTTACHRRRIVGTALCAFAHDTAFAALTGPNLRDDPACGHLLALGDVDRRDHAIDASLVDVLHLHRLQH